MGGFELLLQSIRHGFKIFDQLAGFQGAAFWPLKRWFVGYRLLAAKSWVIWHRVSVEATKRRLNNSAQPRASSRVAKSRPSFLA